MAKPAATKVKKKIKRVVTDGIAHVAEESHHRPLYFVASATNVEARPPNG